MRILLLFLLVAPLGSLAAQIPYDSLPADTLQRDTSTTTERYLEAQADVDVRLPALPRLGPEGPQPAMARVVFSRDSMDWALAESVSDLMMRVPGLYLWRGGWLGRTEYPNYRLRGPASVEYFVDGLPFLPVGPDSLGVDPSYFSLSLYDRIEVEQWPGGLRVLLYTRRHERKAPATRIGIAAGDKSVARYIGALEKRFASGLGFAFMGERMVVATTTGLQSASTLSNVWLQAGYVPNERFGTQIQLLYSNPERKPYVDAPLGTPDTLEFGLKGSRKDAQFRTFWRPKAGEFGWRVDGLVGRTQWKGSGVAEELWQGGAVVGWKSPTASMSARAFGRSRWTPMDFQVSGGWVPLPRLSAGVDLGYQTHDGSRSSRWAGLRAGAEMPLGVMALATLRTGSIVSAPAIRADSAQKLTDWEGRLSWQKPWGGLEVGYGHTDAFRPQAYRSFLPTVPAISPSPGTDWVTVGWRARPLTWLTFQGWYSDPLGKDLRDGQPPTHSLTTATIRSKFLRTFRSTVFDLKAQVAYESWGDGIIGRTGTGTPIALNGASFWRMEIAFRIDSFQLYWDRYNMQASRRTYVPGFLIQPYGSTFGVRWEFLN